MTAQETTKSMTHEDLIIGIERKANEVSKAKQSVYALRHDLEATNERFYEALESYIHDGNTDTKVYIENKRAESRKLEEQIEAGLTQIAILNESLQNAKNDYANRYAKEGAKPNMTQTARWRLSKKTTYQNQVEMNQQMEHRTISGCDTKLKLIEWNHANEYRLNRSNVEFYYGDSIIDADIVIYWSATPLRHYIDTPPESEVDRDCEVYINGVYDENGEEEPITQAQREWIEEEVKQYVFDNIELP